MDQQRPDAETLCLYGGDVETRIAACTRITKSEREPAKSRSIAYNIRGVAYSRKGDMVGRSDHNYPLRAQSLRQIPKRCEGRGSYRSRVDIARMRGDDRAHGATPGGAPGVGQQVFDLRRKLVPTGGIEEAGHGRWPRLARQSQLFSGLSA